MISFFSRQLIYYSEYHRDPRNCITHAIGIPVLFVSVLLPLSLAHLNVFGLHVSLAAVLVAPAALLWLMLDAGLGLIIMLFIAAAMGIAWILATHLPSAILWIIATLLFLAGWSLQLVGHSVFEKRRPAFVDNAFQLFIGPMFMAAKLAISLGFRKDLLRVLRHRSSAPPA